MYYYKMSLKLGQEISIKLEGQPLSKISDVDTITTDKLFNMASDAAKKTFIEKQVKNYVSRQMLVHEDESSILPENLIIKKMQVDGGDIINIDVEHNFTKESRDAARSDAMDGGARYTRRRTSRRRNTRRRNTRRRNTRRRSKKR